MLLVGASLVVLAGFRVGQAGVAPDRTFSRADLLQSVRTQHDRWQFYRLDPAALVLLEAGPDGSPGIAGFDDDDDGVVDDPSELGAVGGDDRCLPPSHPDYDLAMDQPVTRVISEGAYVAAQSDEIDACRRAFSEAKGWVFGVE